MNASVLEHYVCRPLFGVSRIFPLLVYVVCSMSERVGFLDIQGCAHAP